MTKFKGREKKILDRMLEIDDEHASILVVKYKSLNLDTMLFELEKVPDRYKEIAIEYNELTSVFTGHAQAVCFFRGSTIGEIIQFMLIMICDHVCKL